MPRRWIVAAALAVCCLAAPSAAQRPEQPSGAITLEGVFLAGGQIRGAALDGDSLYVATPVSLSVYDVSSPLSPVLLARRASSRWIHGELISTGGDLLLLNGGIVAQGLDVWNVEDKSNPVLAASIDGLADEHFSCLLECTWAYGSEGSIVDLRNPHEPVVAAVNWKVASGIGRRRVHRIDEYRPGFMATSPRQAEPVMLDVRRPLQPRVVATTRMSPFDSINFLYTTWPRGGDDRFVLASTENGPCNDEFQAALVTFDTKGWPRDRRFEAAGRFRYKAVTEEERCLSYYMALHPGFHDGGLVALPNGQSGIRVVEASPDGKLHEADSFGLPTSNVWLAFWIDEEVFYALSETGEVYILRFER